MVNAVSELPPDFPAVDPEVLRTIASHAEDLVAWLEHDHAEAARRGHTVSAEASGVLEGWRFVADALLEQID